MRTINNNLTRYDKIKRAFGAKAKIVEADFKRFLQKENPGLKLHDLTHFTVCSIVRTMEALISKRYVLMLFIYFVSLYD